MSVSERDATGQLGLPRPGGLLPSPEARPPDWSCFTTTYRSLSQSRPATNTVCRPCKLASPAERRQAVRQSIDAFAIRGRRMGIRPDNIKPGIYVGDGEAVERPVGQGQRGELVGVRDLFAAAGQPAILHLLYQYLHSDVPE